MRESCCCLTVHKWTPTFAEFCVVPTPHSDTDLQTSSSPDTAKAYRIFSKLWTLQYLCALIYMYNYFQYCNTASTISTVNHHKDFGLAILYSTTSLSPTRLYFSCHSKHSSPLLYSQFVLPVSERGSQPTSSFHPPFPYLLCYSPA